MKNVLWGIGSIVLVAIMMLLAIAFSADISVFLYAVLSGSVVGLALCLFALSQGVRTEMGSSLIFCGAAV